MAARATGGAVAAVDALRLSEQARAAGSSEGLDVHPGRLGDLSAVQAHTPTRQDHCPLLSCRPPGNRRTEPSRTGLPRRGLALPSWRPAPSPTAAPALGEQGQRSEVAAYRDGGALSARCDSGPPECGRRFRASTSNASVTHSCPRLRTARPVLRSTDHLSRDHAHDRRLTRRAAPLAQVGRVGRRGPG